MASKSKKRRRVLGASCILAALIIAGSSFAWFTSKDEVTNRLAASADYDVSIIENFVPPKQWVPGETVTKEEAVVNTGNIDAFVKQQITGDLQITVEVPTAVAPTTSTGYVTLKEAEYGALEAGSFLAWGPNASEIGRKIVYAMDKENEGGHALPQTTDFKPTTNGLYIFRRSITTDNNMDDTKYEYVGYYYVNGTYYKLNRIVPASLVLDTTKNDGSLSEAPTVFYAKESTDTLKKVAMTYDATDADDVQLKLSYSTGTNPNLSAIANLSEEAYKKYRDYVDAVKGKTSWDADRVTTTEVGTYADTTYMKAKNTNNFTGLTDYDEFSSTTTFSVLDNLSNWSQERLVDRATETQAELDAASPGGKFDGSNTTENWTTVYNAAVADRATVNKGVRSAERLAVLKQKVVGLLGTNGLVQDAAYPFHYSSDTYTESGNTVNVVAPTVTLDNPTDTPLGDGDNGAGNPRKLTLDNMYEAGFADNTGTGFGGDVSFSTSPDFGAQFDYANATGALKTAWDEYVLQTQRLTLVQAKIDLYSTTSTTDVARTDPEWKVHLEWLNDKKDEINAALETAKKAYEDEVKKVKADIDQMNLYQDDVNAANEVDTGKPNPFSVASTYVGDQADAATYPSTDKSTVQGSGNTETVTEQTLKRYLINVFGVAYKDSGETTYTGTTDTNPAADSDAYKDIWTYSYDVTKAKVDKNLSKVEEGKLDWDTTVTGTDAMDSTDRAAATGKPYQMDRKVDTMKAYRDLDVAEKLRLYNIAKGNADAITTGDESVGPIDIIVHLANIGDGNTADQWQYIADATGTNEYNFYYTGILESGETSSMLIKSVEMPGTVTQDMFRDLQFDLNVTSESAQVTYDGDIVRPTAANTTITGGKTTADGYAVTDAVKWTKDESAKTAISREDPDGKAEANVTP